MRTRIALVLLLWIAPLGAAAQDGDRALDSEVMAIAHDGNDSDIPVSPSLFALNPDGAASGAKAVAGRPRLSSDHVDVQKAVYERSGDTDTAWFAADLAEGELGCGCGPCPPRPPPPVPKFHATGVLERDQGEWRWVAWHIARPVDAKTQAKALAAGRTPPPLARAVSKDAEAAVKVFEASIGDPKKFAETIYMARKDIVLYGSELRERTVGGAKVKAKLLAWNLGFKVRDGIVAGRAGAIAYIAANVDAISMKRPKDKPVPYRLLALYEASGPASKGGWQLVSAHFSFIAN